LAGGRGDLAISEIRLERVEANLDAADFEIVAGIAERFSGGSAAAAPALPRFSVSGNDLSLRLTGVGPGPLEAKVRSFSIGGAGPDADLSLSGSLAAEGLPGLGRLELPLEVSGRVARDFSRLRLMLSLAARADDFVLARQRFELSYSGGVAALRKVEDKAPLDASLRYDSASGDLGLSLSLEGFAPSRSLALRGKLAALAPWLDIPLRGALALDLPGADPAGIRYRLDLAGELAAAELDGLGRGLGRAELRASGDSGGARIELARLETAFGEASYSGSIGFRGLSVDGELAVAARIPGKSGAILPLSASFRLFGGDRHYAALAETLAAGDVAMRDFVVEGFLGADSLDFSLSFRPPEESAGATPPLAFAGEGLARAGSPRFRCEGNLSFGEASILELEAAFESFDVGSLGPVVAALASSEAAAATGGLRLAGDLYLRTDFSRVAYSTTDFALVSDSIPGAYALLSFSGNDKGATLKRALFSYGGYLAEARGKVDFAEAGRLAFDATMSLADIPYAFAGTLAGEGLFLRGDYGLELSARSLDGETFVAAKAVDLPLPLPGATLIASFDADGRWAGPSDWSLAVASLGASLHGQGGASLPVLGLSGKFGPRGGEVAELSLQDAVSRLRGAASLSYDLSAGTGDLAFKAALSGGKEERYALEGSLVGGAVSGRLEARGSPLARLGLPELKGLVDGTALLAGAAAAPRLSFDASLRDATFRESALSLAAKGGWADGRLSLDEGARLAWRGMELSRLALSFDATTRAASASGRFASSSSGAPLSFAFSAKGRAGQAREGLGVIPLAPEYFIEGKVADFSYRSVARKDWPFTLASTPESASFRGGGGELFFDYRADGRFSAEARDPFPLGFVLVGRSSGGKLDAELSKVDIDLPTILGLAEAMPVSITSGRVSGSIALSGSVSDPEFAGSLNLAGFSIEVPGWLGRKVGPVDLPLVFDGKRISLSGPSVPIGEAKAALRGDALLEGWAFREISASLRSVADDPIPIDAVVLGIRVQGYAATKLDFLLRGDTARLGGRLDIERAQVIINPALFRPGPPVRPEVFLDLDLAIGFGRGVQVLFPNKDIPIVSGYAEPSSFLSIRFDQATEDLAFKGTANLRGGEVFYIQNNFFLKSAKIVFNETSDFFDPRVTLYAERRERNEKGPVLVTLRADNAPIVDFKPRLSSDPTMSETDIAALLGESLLGISEGGTVDLRKAIIASSEFIPQLNATKAFERKVREALGLDLLFVRTQVVQRWLIDVSRIDPTTPTGDLGAYLDETELYAGKYLGEGLFLYGSARLREADPLVGSGLLRLDSELGVEFDTPFGLLLWSVKPTPAGLENLYISDQSLSLTWRLQL
ncbi:MAG: translocation/assembly module TamB domain-containing protein, partial [Spirochaetaceae bacterium]|nr:translocation/assembly module TamB domain-containing protein [Spirochaetaceae bacterium]